MNKLRGADGLRAIACLMVIFHHLSQELILPGIPGVPPILDALTRFFTSVGSAGVSVFFVLSGFLLSMPFWNNWLDGKDLPDLRVYAARRAGRIMPGFYLNLFFFFLISLLWMPDAPAIALRYYAGLSFTAGFHWLTLYPAELNGPLWSIGFEVVSYVLMPLGMAGLFLVFGRKRRFALGFGWWIAVCLLMIGANQLIQNLVVVPDIGKGWQYGLTGGAKFWMPRYNPIGFFGHFALGILAAGLSAHWSRAAIAGAQAAASYPDTTASPERRSPARRRAFKFDLASLGFLIAWVALMVNRTDQDQFSLNLQGQPYYFPLFPALAAGLLACLTQSRIMAGLFDNRFFRYTARVSFGLYLWHYFVIKGFNGAISDWGEWLILVGVTLAVSYAVATLSWKFLEEPILRRIQAWKPRPRGQARSPGSDRAPGLGKLCRPTRFSLALMGAAAVLLLAPVWLVSQFRPLAWQVPTPSENWFAFNESGPVTGLGAGPDGSLLAASNGRDLNIINADKTSHLLYRLPGELADVRLSYPLHPPALIYPALPSLSNFRGENDFLWNPRLGPDGRVYLAAGAAVLVLDRSGQLLKRISLPTRGSFGVMDLCFDSTGRLYAGDGDLVYRFDNAGQPLVWLDGGQPGADGNALFSGAAGLSFSADGQQFYLCDHDSHQPERSRLLVFPVASGQVAGPALIQPAPGALFCALGPGGDLYISNAFAGQLYRRDDSGRLNVEASYALRQNAALAFSKQEGASQLFAACWSGSIDRIGSTR